MDDSKYPESELTGKIIGIAIETHKKLGPGYNEKIYQRVLARELDQNKIPHKSQPKICIIIEDFNAGYQILDFIIDNKVILELKSSKEINNEHIKQMISYLKATNIKIGLILNFGKSKLEIKRIIL